jgi:cytidine deaminase
MDEIDGLRLERLRGYADRARPMHYAPYSDFIVLAAVEADDGQTYAGANIEIVNYSLCKHAEEVAILAAIVAGQDPRRPWLRAMYVAGAAPCGSCRQFMFEFATEDAVCVFERIDQERLKAAGGVSAAGDGVPDVWRLSKLLPEAFGPREGLQ